MQDANKSFFVRNRYSPVVHFSNYKVNGIKKILLNRKKKKKSEFLKKRVFFHQEHCPLGINSSFVFLTLFEKKYKIYIPFFVKPWRCFPAFFPFFISVGMWTIKSRQKRRITAKFNQFLCASRKPAFSLTFSRKKCLIGLNCELSVLKMD